MFSSVTAVIRETRGEEMNVIFAKWRSRVGRSEIDDADRFFHSYKRQAKHVLGFARVCEPH